jgi:hypothetical protein
MPGNRRQLNILEWEPEGTRRRGRPKERWIDGVRRGMTNHGLGEEDTRDKDRWRNLVLDEGKTTVEWANSYIIIIISTLITGFSLFYFFSGTDGSCFRL